MNGAHRGRCSLWVVAVLASATTFAQDTAEIRLPEASPRAQTTQTIGVSEVTIDYGRPGVRGRQIWGDGGVVGFQDAPGADGQPLPWRTGANAATTVTLSHDAAIEGQEIAAGTYGLLTAPRRDEWTLLFSRSTGSAFRYDPNDDALRVEVVPEAAPFRERLLFEVEELDDPGCGEVALRWERVRVPFRLCFDTDEIVLAQAREVLAAEPDGWQPWFLAARYSADHQGDAQEALAWIEASIEREETSANLRVKATLLERLGRASEAEATRELLAPFERDSWQRTEEILEWMRVEPGVMVADVGAGDGYLSAHLARAVGDAGQVFAVDISESVLGRLSERVERDAIGNVTVVRGEAANPRLPPGVLRAVVIVNSYHEMPEYEAMLRQIVRALEPGGRLVLVEPMSERSRGKSREEQTRNHDLALELARQEVQAAGLRILEAADGWVETPGGGTQWLLVAER